MKQITSNNQKIVDEVKKDRREGNGRVLAISRNVYHLLNSDTYYVKSESGDDIYYFAKFKQDVLESCGYCSCKDNSTRGLKCKHLFAIEFAIKWGTIKDIIDKIPSFVATAAAADIDQSTSNDIHATATKPVVVARRTKSYLDDDYDF